MSTIKVDGDGVDAMKPEIGSAPSSKSGPLWKRSRLGLFWNFRIVKVTRRQLQYHNPRAGRGAPRHQVSLDFATIEAKPSSNQKRYIFEIITSIGLRLEFAAESSELRQEWMEFIRKQIDSRDTEYTLDTSNRQLDGIVIRNDNDNDEIPTMNDGHDPRNEVWNRTYQSILDMDESSINMAIAKVRRMHSLSRQFIQTAQLLGRTIIAEYSLPIHLKTITPIDSDLDENAPESLSFIAEGIVFQFSHAGAAAESDDRLQMKLATHDLHGTSAYAYATTQIEKLHTPLSCTIDYMGFRLFAVGFIPIYDDTKVAFGRVTTTTTQTHIEQLVMDDDAMELLEQCAEKLNLAQHLIVPAPQCQPVLISTSPDVQIHRGDDSLLYMTTLSRVLPPNVIAPPTSNVLDDVWCSKQLRIEYMQRLNERLSPNVFRHDVVASGQLCEQVRRAGIRLRQEIVPELVQSLDLLEWTLVDSAELQTVCHAQGVNMHLLGLIATSTRMPHVREIVVCDMVARAMKIIQRTNLRKMVRSHYMLRVRRRSGSTTSRPMHIDEDYDKRQLRAAQALHVQLRDGIVDLFNMVLGRGSAIEGFWMGSLHEQVLHTFEYDLSLDEMRRLHRPLLFQALQMHCGVAFTANCVAPLESNAKQTDEISSIEMAFEAKQIVEIEARCKFHMVRGLMCHEFMERQEHESIDNTIHALRLKLEMLESDTTTTTPQIDIMLNQQCKDIGLQVRFRSQWEMHRTLNRLSAAYMKQGRKQEAKDCCRRALELHQSHGVAWLQGQLAVTYCNLVAVYMGDSETITLTADSYALAMHHLKLLYGPHHPFILELHDMMASHYIILKMHDQAVQHYQRAIDLALTSMGKSHPMTGKLYYQMGILHELMQNLDQAKNAHEKSCLIYEGLAGPVSLDVARCCFHLSRIMATRGDLNSAHYYNQRALKIREQLLGPYDPLTLESYRQVAWQACKREDGAEGIPNFEKLIKFYKQEHDAAPMPDPTLLMEIKKMIKAIIRLKVRSLTVDQVANLQKLYTNSRDQDENSNLKSKIMDKLYQDNPSEYMNELLDSSSKGVAAPGYATATAELAIILRLMEEEDDESEEEVALNGNLDMILQRGRPPPFTEQLAAENAPLGKENKLQSPPSDESKSKRTGESSLIEQRRAIFEKPNTIVES